MKKTFGILFITFLMTFFLSINCFALDNTNATSKTAVNAKYHQSQTELYSAAIKNGKAKILTQEGISFGVVLGDDYNGFVFVVHHITREEKQAFEWLDDCVSGNSSDFNAYEFYLEDSKKNKIKIPSGTEIETTVDNTNSFVTGVSCDGELYKIESKEKDGLLFFVTESSADYYLIRKNMAENSSNEIEDSSHSNDTSNKPDDSSHPDTSSTQIDAGIVQTGDIVNYSVWGLLLLISVVVVCYYINNRKLNR